jgi:hypothetical protein
MSLRADIRSAYDDITPPAPALQAQIRMLVASEDRAALPSRRSGSRWMKGLRGTFGLVAALLVVLIVATVLVGGRVWHDWNLFTNRPAPAGQIDPVQQLALLEARPLHIPATQVGEQCPVGPLPSASTMAGFPEPIHSWLGTQTVNGGGPAYAIGGSATGVSAWGVYTDVVWVIEPQVTGLVLIRGRDTLNHALPVVYVGQYAAGAELGTDTVAGRQVVQRAELALDAGHHPATSGNSGWGIYEVQAGLSSKISSCRAFQIDGEGFSEVFVPQNGWGPVRAPIS